MTILIINSKNHWLNGWAKDSSKLKIIIKVLQKSGFNVRSVEVESLAQLQNVLNETSLNTLVWINAYWVNIGENKLDWLNAYVEQHKLPLIGQSQKTLENLLKKDICQSMLKDANIPVPTYITIHKHQIKTVENIITDSTLSFPCIIKPTNESRSLGVKVIHTITEACKYVELLFEKYPNGNVIIEEFLPMQDVTCGHIQLQEQALLLPSYNLVEGVNCETEIYSEEHYSIPNLSIKQTCIHDESIRAQLKAHVPTIIETFNIQSITRVDGRANKDGILNFFDINGMPGLNFPSSAIIKQCFNHFPLYNHEYVFECLINTIILDKLIEYNFNIPTAVSDHNLFKLESETTMKLSVVESVNSY